ncbi:MAG: type II secretion system F family protein [Actinobacteria bacterium]|nr:type II secretion system F family protein [Actinomycetota bacterium]MBM3711968.1 type II secretion system F family protein [Actinomycetota bacterium]
MIYLLIFIYYGFICAGIFLLFLNSWVSLEMNTLYEKSNFIPLRNKRRLDISFLNPFFSKIGSLVGKFTGKKLQKRYSYHLRNLIFSNNLKITPDTFIGYKLLSSIAVFFTVIFVLKNTYFSFFAAAAAAAACFFIPDLLLKRYVLKISEDFNNDMPYVIDLLYISALSGQNIYNSIKIITEKYKGNICEELKRFLKDIDFGIGKTAAYSNAASRNTTESFKNLLFMLIQAEKYGSSISEVLKQKSKYIRFEINQKYEIRSRRISILLLFPLVFLILPAFVLLVGGPLVFSIGGSFLFF